MDSTNYAVEPVDESTSKCDCCLNASRSIWGLVRGPEGPVASYFLHWTVGASLQSHPANMDLIVGKWGDGTTSRDRVAVSLIHFDGDDGPGVAVIDADERPIAGSDLISKALRRGEVVGTPLAAEVFGIFDAVLRKDPRLRPPTDDSG